MRVRTVVYNHPGMVEANAKGLVPTADLHNNVGRRCTLAGDTNGRLWAIETPLRSPVRLAVTMDSRHYIVRHAVNGAYRVVSSRDMGDLY